VAEGPEVGEGEGGGGEGEGGGGEGEGGGGEGEEGGFEREGVGGVSWVRVERVVEGTGAVADLNFIGEVRNGEVEYADEFAGR
jgi:hypothetical protein